MKPYTQRTPDTQHVQGLKHILKYGEVVGNTPQGVGALTSMTVPKMFFDLDNGFPVITERDLSKFWKSPIDELFSFVRGVQTQDELTAAGCKWWSSWTTKEKCAIFGLAEGDLGPASYGGAFARFPMPDGGSFNQFAHLVDQLRRFPDVRTHVITPWIPFWNGRGGMQKAVVSPCHGWIHCRVINGKLVLHMSQRSGDMPIGVPSNMIQYAALTMALADLLGLPAWQYVHSFSDAHIYTDQIEAVKELITREPRALPTVRLTKKVTDLFKVDSSYFELSDYNPHPAMKIPVAV